MRFLLTVFFFASLSAHAFDPATQDDSLALARHFKPTLMRLTRFDDREFTPTAGETVTLMGGTDVYQMHEVGDFEASLHLSFPDKKLRIRNIGWPADTVYRQQRPMFFFTEKGDTREGSVPDQREKIMPGIFVIRFGKMESLDGLERLDDFKTAYERLVDALDKISPRMVLLAPTQFSKEGPAAELADARNQVLEKYSEVIKEIAMSRNIFFVNNPEELGLKNRGGSEDSNLHSLIREKNKLWLQYYRPTNWAFLFGDRQNVPSSRNYDDDEKRWFVEEIMQIPPLIEKAEKAIWKAASATKGELK